jgi:hypothetical protein
MRMASGYQSPDGFWKKKAELLPLTNPKKKPVLPPRVGSKMEASRLWPTADPRRPKWDIMT